jgi:NAD(P)-dependent dehydrogenase (short-subunit alcohol dehydrogenase family)
MEDAPKIPPQRQDRMPAFEGPMTPQPDCMPRYPGAGKLAGKAALVTGGDSGIGRAVAILFAREGAMVGIAYMDEHDDANETKRLVQDEGSDAVLIAGDLASRENADRAVEKTVEAFGGLNVVINNAAQQYLDKAISELDEETLRRTFDSNVMSYFFVTQAALPHLGQGDSLIYTTSVNAYNGNGGLVSYSSTRGASLALARSMAVALTPQGIRVNAVAPGPIWTPFIPGTMPDEKVEDFGQQVPMNRAGQPWEVATSFLFLASEDGSYFSGQCLHPNGGVVVNA